MTALRRPSVLVIEDDESVRLLLTEVLAREGFAVAARGDLAGGRAHLGKAGPPDIAVLDHFLPDGVGSDLARELRGRGVPCVVVSGQERSLEAAMQEKVDVWLAKPLDMTELLMVVRELLSPTVKTVLAMGSDTGPS